MIHMPEDEEEPPPGVRAEQSTALPEQTTLVQNEAEAFALEPIEMTAVGALCLVFWRVCVCARGMVRVVNHWIQLMRTVCSEQFPFKKVYRAIMW